jgi:ATP-binding cassette, subfamily B, bacterial PglK
LSYIQNKNLLQWQYLLSRDKLLTFCLIIVTLIAAGFETLSIGILLPLLSVLIGDTGVNFQVLDSLMKFFPLENFGNSEIIRILFVYLLVIFTGSICRGFQLYILNFVAFRIGASLAKELYNCILHSDYEVSKSLSSSDVVIDLMPRVNTVVFGVILPAYTAITNALFLIMIGFLVSYVVSSVLLILFCTVAVTFVFSWFFTKQKLRNNGRAVSDSLRKCAELAIDAVKNKKYIDLQEKHTFYSEQFSLHDGYGKKAASQNQFIIGLPRLILEVILASVFVLYILYSHVSEISLTRVVTELALAMVIFQRVFPLAQSIYRSITLIGSNFPVLRDALKLLDLKQIENGLGTEVEVEYKNYFAFSATFSYLKSQEVLVFKDFYVNKSEKVLIIGDSGIGKSTMLDLMMLLLEVRQGGLIVDGVPIYSSGQRQAWQRKISYVEQDFYVANKSTFENIVNKSVITPEDRKQVIDLCRALNLHKAVTALPYQYDSPLGDGGSKLSGGQRQRLMIARAIFSRPEILFFDEATSALDPEQKQNTYECITKYLPDVTLIAISHDSTDQKFFNRCLEVKDVLKKITNNED